MNAPIPSFFKICVKTLISGFIIVCFLLGAAKHVFAVSIGDIIDNGDGTCSSLTVGTVNSYPHIYGWGIAAPSPSNNGTRYCTYTLEEQTDTFWFYRYQCHLFEPSSCDPSSCDDDNDGVCNEQNPQNFGPPEPDPTCENQ